MARTDTLGNFLTDVADAIRLKTGSSEPIQASTFDTAISNIPSGTTIQDFADVNNAYEQAMYDIDNYLQSIPQTYSGSTTDAITLYTPSANTKSYFIRKNYYTSKYQIIWLTDDRIIYDDENGTMRMTTYMWNGEIFDPPLKYTYYTVSRYVLGLSTTYTDYYMSNDSYDTLEEVIVAMQSSSTEYTSGNSSSFNNISHGSGRNIAYTNMPVVKQNDNSFTIDPNQYKISTNETIAVIE